MDMLLCGSIALLETIWLKTVVAPDTPSRGDGMDHFFQRLLLITFAQYLAFKIYRIFIYPHWISPLRHLPGPRDGHFFLGQTINMFKQEYPFSIYVKWVRQFPDTPVIRYLSFANAEVLVPLTPDGLKEVLQTKCYDFSRSRLWLRMVVEFAGWGIITFDGDAHKASRKMLSTAFSLANIRRTEPVFKDKAFEICETLSHTLSASGGGGGIDDSTAVMDAIDIMSKATLDIMGVASLGVDLSSLREGADREKSSKARGHYDFRTAYDTIFAGSTLGKALTFANSLFPFPVVRWLPLEENRRALFAAAWIRNALTQLVRDRYREVRGAVANGTHLENESRDLLTFIVEESGPGGAAEGVPEDEVVGHLIHFMTAGHETSASVLSWSIYVMAIKPSLQKALHEEIRAVTTKKADPAYSDIDGLSYLGSFVKEVMRVYSPAATTHREATKDLTLQGISVPKGATLDIIPAVTMLSPAIWGDDVDEFDPTRWGRLTEEQASPYVFSAFSNGPRICLGKAFALMEIKIILVELVRRFRFLKVERPFKVEVPGLTTRPQGMEIRFEAR
ncbi:cytochrome P450 [Apiospora sp. TS-2023a]